MTVISAVRERERERETLKKSGIFRFSILVILCYLWRSLSWDFPNIISLKYLLLVDVLPHVDGDTD